MLIAILRNSGQGCDYTVGCGTKVLTCPDDVDKTVFINETLEDYCADPGPLPEVSDSSEDRYVQFYEVEEVVIEQLPTYRIVT